jgi:hypothetical protein
VVEGPLRWMFGEEDFASAEADPATILNNGVLK